MKLGKMKSSWAFVACMLAGGIALCGNALAGETLFSNYVFSVAPAGENGKLWAFSQDNSGTYSGITYLSFSVAKDGSIVTEPTKREQVSDTLTAVHDGLQYSNISDEQAEYRRLSAIYAGSDLGLVLPIFAMDSNDRYRIPAGYFTIRDVNNIIENPIDISAAADIDTLKNNPMMYTISGFAYDSTAKRLWVARGALGLMVNDRSGKNGAKDTTFVLNYEKKQLEKLENVKKNLDLKNNPEIFDVCQHPKTGELWLATAKGILKRNSDGKFSTVSTKLDSTARVTGLWMGGDPLQIIAETNYKKDGNVVGGLWRRYDGKDKDFSKVNFLDTAGKVQKKDIYDESDYTVSDVAFLGKTAFVLVSSVGGSATGYLKMDSVGIKAWEKNDNGKDKWLYGYETGATDRNMRITSLTTFPLTDKRMGLAIGTYGNGLSVSADSGASWSVVLNRAKLDNNLGSIRMVPSVILAPGEESLVSYKVGRESKITIEVFSYDMRQVRTIVKDAVRNADASRSSNPKEDFWDGRDDHGKDCTMGVYYIRVKDNHGHIGWGKAMTLGGSFR